MPMPYKIGVDVFDRIVPPASIEERYEILAGWYSATELPERHRVQATALALCWPLLRDHMRVNARSEYVGRVLEYGRNVMDALLTNSDPADRNVVLAAGLECLEAVDRSLRPILEAAKDPEGFSSPVGSPVSDGSSSPSSDGATSSRAPSAPSTPS
jgi:hypothetical protein